VAEDLSWLRDAQVGTAQLDDVGEVESERDHLAEGPFDVRRAQPVSREAEVDGLGTAQDDPFGAVSHAPSVARGLSAEG